MTAITREDKITAHLFLEHATPDEGVQDRLLEMAKRGEERPSIDSRDGLWLAAFTEDRPMNVAANAEFQRCFDRAKAHLTEEEVAAIDSE